MARYVLQSVLRRNSQCAFDWSIKSDPHAGAADESEKSRTHLTMHVDDQIIFRAADLLEQIKERHQCAPSSAARREIAPRKQNDIIERRMAAHDFGVLGGDQPVNARARITCSQLHQDWDCMDDIAQGRRLDDQNSREFRGLQFRCVRVLCPYVFDLAVQLLSRKKATNAQCSRSNVKL